ncbi:DUF7507 domain-containing protein [Litorihabitans aurantiacus]|uniref:DUF11 domain-containing protein n=1 Tax=Litorihabitans aurantiacus TaxID=1930061 RepID=A0AA38CUK3_9MICO|nr:hypothetical protein [Litorihabitans aurantiacus]GMA33446.1 hypothetical protein GCM10025875_34380 [Litorihabitans aurantiacus]
MLAGCVAFAGSAALTPETAEAVPGNPGVPGVPTVIYAEDFENGTGVVNLPNYTSSTGVTYTAAPYWLNTLACNGFIVGPTTPRPGGYCNDAGDFSSVQLKARMLGLLNSPQNSTTNRALSTNTSGASGNAPANGIMFATSGQVPLPSATGRFITFSVDAAATSCQAAQPLLRFYLRNANGTETPVSTAAINPCVGPRSMAYQGAVTNRYGRFPADASVLFNGSSLGIVLRNEQTNPNGNDGAVDNIRVLDATPQLDKSFTPATTPVGTTSTLTLTVTNTSDLAAKAGWAFTDNLPAGLVVAPTPALGGTCTATRTATPGGSAVAVTNGVLAAGQTSCTVTVQVTHAPITAGQSAPLTFENCAANISDAVGIDLPGCASVSFVSNPGISLEKSASTDEIVAGAPVTFTFAATNTGDVPLSGVTVSEEQFTGAGTLSSLTCTPTQPATLAPGGVLTCQATYTFTQGDVDTGTLYNQASVVGTDPFGTTVTDLDDVVLPSDAVAAYTLVKQAVVTDVNDNELTDLGDEIAYSFLVTNTGTTTLTDVSVSDPTLADLGITISCDPAPLAPGTSVTCTADETYVLTQADVDNGEVVNTATASAVPPPGVPAPEEPTDTVEIPVDRTVAYTLVKSAEVTDVNDNDLTDVGDEIAYSFLVTNTGTTTLSDVSVSDPTLAEAGIAITCDPTTLAPGEFVTCTADEPYVVTQADVDNGEIVNTATATATPPPGVDPPTPPTSTVETPTDGTPGLTLVKTVNATEVVLDQEVTYTFVATNTGTLTLDDVTVTVTEESFTGTGELSALDCAPLQPATLAPGEDLTCTATYVITQADVDAGTVDNTASASGTDPFGTTVGDEDDATLPADRAP